MCTEGQTQLGAGYRGPGRMRGSHAALPSKGAHQPAPSPSAPRYQSSAQRRGDPVQEPWQQPRREAARLTCCKYIKVKAHESWGHMPTLGSATQVAPVRGCCISSLWRPRSRSGDARMQSRRCSLPGRYNFLFLFLILLII